MNILDVFRLLLIGVAVLGQDYDKEFTQALIPYMFILLWIKTLTYLAIFKQTRYLIKMILEIINDIKIFLIILLISMTAFTQIMMVTMDNELSS